MTQYAKKPEPETAIRALKEAAERRLQQEQIEAELTKNEELNGRRGPDPARYGDWENKGIASDF